MNQDKMSNKDLDGLMQQALMMNMDFVVPERLVVEVIQKQEKRILFRQLMLELAFKAGIAIGSIGILIGVFALAKNLAVLSPFYELALEYRQPAIILFSAAILITFIDQVVLRMYMNVRTDRSLSLHRD